MEKKGYLKEKKRKRKKAQLRKILCIYKKRGFFIVIPNATTLCTCTHAQQHETNHVAHTPNRKHQALFPSLFGFPSLFFLTSLYSHLPFFFKDKNTKKIHFHT